jgi:hypothetical protein
MKTHSCKFFFNSLVIGLAMALPACAPAKTAAALTPILVQLQWIHQMQFGIIRADTLLVGEGRLAGVAR